MQCPQRSRDTLERICARRPSWPPPTAEIVVRLIATSTPLTAHALHVMALVSMSAPVTATTHVAAAKPKRLGGAHALRASPDRACDRATLLGCRRSTGASGGRFTTPRAIPETAADATPSSASPTPQGTPAGPPGEIVDLPIDWQIDFCSRPMKDERGKKMWELLICDESRSFQHAEFFPNNRINSVELSKAIQRVLNEQGARPKRFKFFRSQMQTIITRACNDVGVPPLPSRRCQTLTRWLDQRAEEVYKKHPGYDGSSSPMMGFETSAPKPLPDALRGESWAFVALPLIGVKEEAMQVSANRVFGDLLDIDEALPDDTLVPGIAVYTRRAAALAGWTKGLELGGISVDLDMGTLILDTGVADSWQYARFRQTKELTLEAKEWEDVKAAGGLHFLAIQTDEEAESTDGFWILQDFTASQY